MTPSTRHVLRRDTLRATVVCATDALQSRFGPRFDRTAHVAELTCAGHAFLAPAGLCDEFGLDGTGVLGFEACQPGETFLKIGVGRLVRPSDAPYDFRERYELAETFPVEITPGVESFTARQATPAGGRWSYDYRKTYTLVSGRELHLHYALTNTGEDPYCFEHYNHHWFAFARETIGPDYRLRPSWTLDPTAHSAWLVSAAGLSPKDRELPLAGIHGRFAAPVQPAELTLEHARTGQALSLRTDFSPARFAVWANPEAFCPEVFYRVTLLPGMSAHWAVHYTFLPPTTRRASLT